MSRQPTLPGEVRIVLRMVTCHYLYSLKDGSIPVRQQEYGELGTMNVWRTLYVAIAGPSIALGSFADHKT